MTSLPDHLEQYLGRIEGGWSNDANGAPMPFKVLRFGRGSGPGTISFVTMGLGKRGLKSRVSEQVIYLELLMIVPDSLREGPVPGILEQLGNELLEGGEALLRGDVVGPRGPLFAGSNMEALYASMPAYFPYAFNTCHEADRDIVIVWLIPISAREAAFARDQGWDAFEKKLAETDPDLADVYRESLPEFTPGGNDV